MKGPLSQLFSILFISIFVLHGCSSNSKSKGDTRPDAFTISAQNDVEPDTVVESDPFTIEGINRPATVTLSGIEGATFSVNGGAPLSSGGKVNNGDQVVIQAPSPDTYEGDATLTVEIGGERSEFVISTGPDETPPEVTILFPPPSTMTEGSTVFVRGTVEDLYGEVNTLLVNGVEVDVSEGLPEWSANVPLEEGGNTITVTATDVAGNENNSQSVNVRMDPEGGAFPDNENPSRIIGYSGSFALVGEKDAYVVPDYTGGQILSIELDLGKRSVLSSDVEEDPVPFDNLRYLTVGETKAFVTSFHSVFQIQLDSGVKDVILDGENGVIENPRAVKLVRNHGKEILYLSDGNKVYTVDMSSYAAELFVDGVDFSESPINEDIISIEASTEGDALYLLTFGSIYRVDTVTRTVSSIYSQGSDRSFWDLNVGADGEIFIADNTISEPVVWYLDTVMHEAQQISSSSYPSSVNSFESLSGVDCIDGRGFCLLVDPTLNTVFAMDKIFGHRVILTRSVDE